jgi:hypothetical protein
MWTAAFLLGQTTGFMVITLGKCPITVNTNEPLRLHWRNDKKCQTLTGKGQRIEPKIVRSEPLDRCVESEAGGAISILAPSMKSFQQNYNWLKS